MGWKGLFPSKDRDDDQLIPFDSSLRLVEATDQSTICFKAVWSFIFHIPRLIHLIWDDNPKKTPNCQGGGSFTQKMIDTFVLFHFQMNS
jgi:hypothetical protein